MKGLLNKHFWKFFVGFLAIMIAGFFALVWANTYHNGESEQKSAEKYLKDLEQAYKNDTYGGTTPEETLQLFIDALKKGDIDLAVKYFLPDNREEIKLDLIDAKKANKLTEVINRASLLRLSKLEDYIAFFIIKDSNNVMQYQVSLGKNKKGIWKITDL